MLETLQKISPTDKVIMGDTGRQSAGNADLQWLGGFIDGEGSFCFAKRLSRKQARGIAYTPCASIVNTHKPTIERIASILTEWQIGHWITKSNHTLRTHKDTWCVDVRGIKKMMRYLPLIIPYLFTKKPQAEALLEFATLRMGGTIHRRYAAGEVELVERVQRANRSGPSETKHFPLADIPASEDIVQALAIN